LRALDPSALAAVPFWRRDVQVGQTERDGKLAGWVVLAAAIAKHEFRRRRRL